MRASKRRRTNQEDQHEGEKSIEKSEREEKLPVIILAHGAGAPSSSDWMIRWKYLLAEALNAVEVVTFDYPYIAGGKKRRPPPKAEKLVDFHRDIVNKTMAKYPGHPLVLAGKSMGSRVSCMVAEEKDVTALAVVCLGYPLKGTKGVVRDETLLQLKVPVIFVQGSKDGLCPLKQLEGVREKMHALTELHVIEGGDHSFKIAKKYLQSSSSSQEEAEDQAVGAITKFVSSCLGKEVTCTCL